MTENGWPRCGPDQLDRTPVPGTGGKLVIALQQGRCSTIMRAFAADINRDVESLFNASGYADEGGWTPTNSVGTSNHLGGTAMDLNWNDHPMGPKVPDPKAGWQWSAIIGGPEEPRVRQLLDYYTIDGVQLIWWGNDWDSPNDSMHFQMGYGTYERQDLLQKFIDTKIRSDGFSKFHEDVIASAPVDLVALVAEAFENRAGVDYSRYADRVVQSLKVCGCTTVPRIAMWFAQVGEESGGLQYQTEIADGSEYEGNSQLGNVNPGDGKRYKGRDFIQITGRYNYTNLSKWAWANGFVTTSTYFVDFPERLATDAYSFLGVDWYWTVAQPTLNDAADNEDVITATELVNGGDHGLADRQQRWQHCMDMGDRLLALIQEDDFMANVPQEEWDAVRDEILKRSPSRSWFARDGKLIETLLGWAMNIDGNVHVILNVIGHLAGVPDSTDFVEKVADGDFADKAWINSNKEVKEFAQEFCKTILPLKGVWAQQVSVKSASKKTPRKNRP